MSRFSRLHERFRQLRYPPEFRIGEPITRPISEHETEVDEPPPQPLVPDLADDVMAQLATNVWRTKRKIGTDDVGELPRAQRAAARSLLAVWETLEDAGVKIQDHDGMPFHPGTALDVLAYETRPDVTIEVVLETVRPSIYRSGRRIQMGQVIVAQPEEGNGNGARNH